MTDISNLDSFEIICSAGKSAAENINEGRWLIGSLAALVGKEYGRNRIADFATNINVSKGSVREYRTVYTFYQYSARTENLRKNELLTYTHFRHAMKYSNPELALDKLEIAINNELTTDAFLRKVIKEVGKGNSGLERLDSFEGLLSEALHWFQSKRDLFGGELHITVSRIKQAELA